MQKLFSQSTNGRVQGKLCVGKFMCMHTAQVSFYNLALFRGTVHFPLSSQLIYH